DCYKSGTCGFEADLGKAFSAYTAAGEKGFDLGYSNAAWVMLNQGRVPEESQLFERLIEQGRDDEIGVSDYLDLMYQLALSNEKLRLGEIYSAFEASAYSGGLPANLLAMYFMLENSLCAGSQNDALVRQKSLLESQQYGKPFSLKQWNKDVDRDAVLNANRTLLKALNPQWKDSVLQNDWCRNVTLPRS
ncbi:MAG: hypothetical protein HUJ31_18770, partial [Pseudomonadales bacterium]|nr:hypothetical protein [Pseudomonadales bacterium]